MGWALRHTLGATILLSACGASSDFDLATGDNDTGSIVPDGFVGDSAMPPPDGISPPIGACGNGTPDPGEACDDANLMNGDGCNPTCTLKNNVTTFAVGVGAGPVVLAEGGALYVGDGTSARLRRWDIATKASAVIAGTGSAGWGDAPIGTNARIGAVGAIATDGKSLFIIDTYRIRAISLTPPHAVTTIAGSGTKGFADGLGPVAMFDDPRGLTFFGGMLYLLESARPTVRRVDPLTGAVATIAGSASTPGTADGCGPTARLQSPRYMTAHPSGVLYLADTLGPTIRSFNPADNCVKTIAGTAGKSGYTDGIGLSAVLGQPRGIATDGPNLYFVEFNQHTLRQIELSTMSVTTNAGQHCGGTACTGGNTDGFGTAARFNGPWSLTFDAKSGSLFVGDAMNQAIRRVQ